MSRGFTLMELLITIVVLGILLSVVAPSFRTVSVNSQMKRAANELNGFMHQARSEAMWRNRDLWAHFSFSSHPAVAKEWVLTLTDSDVAREGNKILVLRGSSFKDLQFDWTYTANKIKFDGHRGRIKDGSINFYPTGFTRQSLRLKSSFAGNRIMICAVSGGDYGYPLC